MEKARQTIRGKDHRQDESAAVESPGKVLADIEAGDMAQEARQLGGHQD
jgi:hypothetical protein